MSTEVQRPTIEQIEQATAEAAFLHALLGAVAELRDGARQRAIDLALADKREQVAARVDDDGLKVKLGQIKKNEDKPYWAITDPDKFDAWVQKAHPEKIRSTLTIDASELDPAELADLLDRGATVEAKVISEWEDSLLKRCAELGEALDESTGEVPDGIGRKIKTGSWVLTTDHAAKVRVKEALRAMLDAKVPLPTGLRELIEGGR